MADLTTTFNGLLKGHEAPPTRRFNTDTADDFLKEAYRINSRVAQLHSDLRNLRQAYLSTAAPRKTHLRTVSRNGPAQTVYLTDRDREEIDANAKLTLRDLIARFRALEDAENLRQATDAVLIQKKYSRVLGSLGSWAAGGGGGASGKGKTAEHTAAEAAARQLADHRKGVLDFLKQRLEEAAKTQRVMIETRLAREEEKKRSVLAKARGASISTGRDASNFHKRGSISSLATTSASPSLPADEFERRPPLDDLTEDQRQMFEKGNQDMLKHFDSTLDKIRTADRSLVEIAELHNELISNLSSQSESINQLVVDSFETNEGVEKGNKQLKSAAQRAGPARYTCYAAAGLCALLVVWDLVY
ncbi:hypothetical protein B0T19DRAFT_202729 [Cercophora scortea]|uniref:Syntaxin 18 n=1 Tax=Cercophora scortea TaxID=314031 RepID=A0AAE0IFN4_9PEZI|nr:hypothetical protein B0T19DRAFT_202729 [Cercophora scortea]